MRKSWERSSWFAALSSYLTYEPKEASKMLLLGCEVVVLVVAAYILLVAAGVGYTKIWLNDVMGLTEAAYRAYSGQVPSIDFYSVLGAGAYYPAALGFALGLDASTVLAFGQVVVAAILLSAAAVICGSRFSIVPSTLVILFLALLIVAPMTLGGASFDATFGVYYNKHGWAALAVVLLCYVEPRNERRAVFWQDAIALFVALLFLLLLAINFAAVAVAFLAANALVSSYNRRLSFLCLGAAAVTLAAVEVSTGYSSAYLHDIVSGTRGQSAALGGFANPRSIAGLASNTWLSLMTCFMAFGALLVAGRRRFFDLAFFIGSVTAVYVLGTQTMSGSAGVPALIVPIACFGELARRRAATSGSAADLPNARTRAVSLTVLGFLVLFASKPVLQGSFAVAHYFSQTALDARATPADLPAGLAGFRAAPDHLRSEHEVLGHDDSAHTTLARLRRARQAQLTASAYLDTVAEGVKLLGRSIPSDRSVVVFDVVNPFTVPLHLRPTKYGYPLLYEGGGFSRASHPSPERFFSDADYAMVPVLPSTQSQLDIMLELYGPHLKAHFEEIARSPHWHLWAKKRVE